MPRTRIYEPKRRLHMELPERVRSMLEEVRVMTEADSVTEVVRRSFALYVQIMTRTKQEKARLFLRMEDGKEMEVLVV